MGDSNHGKNYKILLLTLGISLITDPEVNSPSIAIIETQEKEIALMEELLEKLE